MNVSRKLLLTGLMALSVQANATTIAVNSTADNILAGDGSCTLREALANANGDAEITGGDCLAGDQDDTINLTGVLGTITLNSPLEVTSHVDFQGPSHEQLALSGNERVRVLEIASDAVVNIEEMTIKEGYDASRNGAGILNRGTLTLKNSIVSENVADYDGGGGISNIQGTLTLMNSTVSGNFADVEGGGINNRQGTLTLIDSTVSENVGGFYGGGINNRQGTLTLMNSTVANNISGFGGGGISSSGSGTLNLMSSTIYDNNAGAMGGGIYGDGDEGSLIQINNSTVSGNSSFTLDHGGIFNFYGTLILTNSTISGNGGRGINNIEASLILRNTLIANHEEGADCVSDGEINVTNTLIEDGSCEATWSGDPNLGSLEDNGGPTLTHALLPGSLAIDQGDDALCATAPVNGLDQRGEPRTGSSAGSHCDLGAYEAQLPTDWQPASEGCQAVRAELKAALTELKACKAETPKADWNPECAEERERFHACAALAVKRERGGICKEGDASEQPEMEAACFGG